MSKQAYYKYDENAVLHKMAQEEFVIQYVRSVREKDPGIGGVKLWFMYCKAFAGSSPVGRDRFTGMINKYDMKLRKRIRKPRTTDSRHGFPTCPNLIKNCIPDSPNLLWVSDITYIAIWIDTNTYVFCYLSMILDSYTEEIIGWDVGSTLETEYPLNALKMALKRIDRKDNRCLIHHSDRGCQYASNEYVALLKARSIRISMTESGDPKDNAQAERINNTMKNELLKGKVFHSIKEVKNAVAAAVEFYNSERPHMSIDMMTPVEAANHNGEIAKKWTSYRQQAIKNQRNNQKETESTEKSLPLYYCKRFSFGLRPLQ